MRAGVDVSPDVRRSAGTVGPAPYFLPLGDEVELFRAAHSRRMPVLLTGPTGCGKTRFVEHMAWVLASERGLDPADEHLITVTCHDDMTAADLVGRYLLSSNGTTWLDGPLTRAVRGGAICYLDEVVEARKDTTVILHSLTDHRRILPIERVGATVSAHPDFQLVISYNPGYQATVKDLKPSTRQRFAVLEFTYPGLEQEAEIVAREAGVPIEVAEPLAFLAQRLRALDDAELIDGPGTRLLVHAGELIGSGVAPRRACEVAVVGALTDDPELREAIRGVIDAVLPA